MSIASRTGVMTPLGGGSVEVVAAVRNKQLLMLAIEGLSAAKAAKIVGCSVETARTVYRTPDFQQMVMEQVDATLDEGSCAYRKRFMSLQEALHAQAMNSFQDLVGMLQREDLSAGLRMKINQDFLDRVAETSHKGQLGVTMRWDPKQLSLAAKAAQEMDETLDVNVVGSEDVEVVKSNPSVESGQLSLFND